jgi:hypothetical protein
MHVLQAFDAVFVPWTYCALDLGPLPAKEVFAGERKRDAGNHVPDNPRFDYGSGSMKHRRKRRIPFAAYAALVFNGALCATPFMAAHLISQAYGDKRPPFQTSPEAIVATRQAMDARFAAISLTEDARPRDVWSDLVRTALEEREMARVRGLLLGAPAMLESKDGEALRARIAVADGAGDDAVLQAALAYLPDDVQDAYELQTKSIVSMFSASAPASALPSASPALARIAPETGARGGVATVLIEDEIEPRVATNRLGDLRQHTLAAVGWANDDNTDVPAFLLSGIGLILADPEAREGASVAMSTLRTRTQGPVPLKLYLTRRIAEIVPVAEVKRLLSAELGNELRYTTDAQAVVERVFRTAIDRQKLEPLLAEFRILREIAHDTSVESAIAIVSRVQDGVDLRRAGLVVAAGGDRAVALEHLDGDNLLETARTAIPMTNALKLQLAGIAACLALLAFVALTTFWKSFTRSRPVRKSAVYLMEEHPA